MRYLACVLLLLAGCERPRELTNFLPYLSAFAAYCAQGTAPVPDDPEPDSDTCENCGGTGKLGEDGKVIRSVVSSRRVEVTLSEESIEALLEGFRRVLREELTHHGGSPHPAAVDPPPLDGVVGRRVLTSYDEAARVAVQLDKPLLLTFSQPNCAPCVLLERLQDKEAVEALLMDFVQVKLDTSKDPSLSSKWAVRMTPTEIVRHRGREVSRQTGLTQEQSYLSWLSQSLQQANRIQVPR